MNCAVHFVNFSRSDQFANAVKVMGQPDFIHRVWDYRAKAEIMPGDISVFAIGNVDDVPRKFAYDDSAYF